MLVKAKKTLPNCYVVKSGGFADETTAESSHGSDVHLLEPTQEEADKPLYYMLPQLAKQGMNVLSSRVETLICWYL